MTTEICTYQFSAIINNVTLLCFKHTSPDIIRMIKSRNRRWVGHVEQIRNIINSYKAPERIRRLGRRRRRLGDNITMNIKDVGWEGVDFGSGK
jgi:hypothetical protein